MTITSLKAAPHLLAKTLSLIEKSFHYKDGNQFLTDFAPLMRMENHENCFIKIDENENVLAHIGFCEKKINGFSIGMLGGISVSEKNRGEGLFQELMQDVLTEKRSDVSFFLLWSDLEKLYNKFGFYLCGLQMEVPHTSGSMDFQKTKLHTLDESDKAQIQKLYRSSFAQTYTSPERTTDDWKMLELITSADLFIQKSGSKIENYFVMNKGQDLPNIVYEYGTSGNMRDVVQAASSYGKVWMGLPIVDTEELHYQFFLCPGDKKLFTDFIKSFTRDSIIIRDVNQMKQEVYFDFNGETLALTLEEFLRGIFGPGIFDEMESIVKPIFISGLESI